MGKVLNTVQFEMRSAPVLYSARDFAVETLSPALTDDIEALARDVLQGLCRKNFKISTAESCTGGMLASLLTDVDGCGHAFERGYVVYTNEAKQDLLGVPAAALREFGPVSKETAIEMALGGLERSNADYCIAITGFAGRGAPEDEPGLVHFALAPRRAWPRHKVAHFGDAGRGPVRLACLQTALRMIKDALPA